MNVIQLNGISFGEGTAYLADTVSNPPNPIIWANSNFTFSLQGGLGSNPRLHPQLYRWS